jgi:hypothetical protein
MGKKKSITTEKPKTNRGAKPVYTTSHVAVCRSVPKGMIPALDKWLEQERQKHLIPIDDDGNRITP